MSQAHRVRLAAKNEGIEYRDGSGVYRFDVQLEGRNWIVYLPGSKGEQFQKHDLTAAERDLILPRIVRYLARHNLLSILGRRYSVSFVDRPWRR